MTLRRVLGAAAGGAALGTVLVFALVLPRDEAAPPPLTGGHPSRAFYEPGEAPTRGHLDTLSKRFKCAQLDVQELARFYQRWPTSPR